MAKAKANIMPSKGKQGRCLQAAVGDVEKELTIACGFDLKLSGGVIRPFFSLTQDYGI